MNKSYIAGVGIFTGIAGALLANPAQADINIPENIAQKTPIPININPGQTSAINFENDEIVSYLILSDRSRIVYSLNASPESGEARSIFLRNIKPLNFPGEIASSKPNLFVVAVDNQGRQKQYEFIIDNTQNSDKNINIIPQRQEPKSEPINVINTDLGAATPEDIRIGLKYKLQQREIDPEDSIALYTAEAIAITLNGDQTLLALATEFDIPLSVLSEFGRTGLAQKAKFRVQKITNNKVNSLRTVRRSLIGKNNNNFVIDTDLGEANIKDLEFGLSVMFQRGYINEQEKKQISAIIKQIKTTNKNLSKQEQEKLQRVARLGLAFNARQRIFGTLD